MNWGFCLQLRIRQNRRSGNSHNLLREFVNSIMNNMFMTLWELVNSIMSAISCHWGTPPAALLFQRLIAEMTGQANNHGSDLSCDLATKGAPPGKPIHEQNQVSAGP